MKPDLLPCPFCGAAPETFPPTLTKRDIGTDPKTVHGRFYSTIRCRCGASIDGPNFDHDMTNAALLWNRRERRLITKLPDSMAMGKAWFDALEKRS